MRAAKVQTSLRIRTVSPEPPLLAFTSSESRGTFRQKARSLVPLNGWACAVKICHDGMLEDTNLLDGAILYKINGFLWIRGFCSSAFYFFFSRFFTSLAIIRMSHNVDRVVIKGNDQELIK